jgi:hypothetical protein
MTGRFEEALAQNPAPKRLGDIQLRYEPSLLIGEAERPSRGAVFSAVLIVGAAFGLGTLGALISGASLETVGGCALLTGLAFVSAVQLDQRARRQRRFVLNFGTTSLRLDFSTPFANQPRTMVVHFDGVRDCTLCTQGDGQIAITVDFVQSASSPQVLREVLVANIPVSQEDAAIRLHRVLKGAFGLGEPPAAEPEPEPDAAPRPESDFEP